MVFPVNDMMYKTVAISCYQLPWPSLFIARFAGLEWRALQSWAGRASFCARNGAHYRSAALQHWRGA